jgi:Icc-related predicted phosphoesterase
VSAFERHDREVDPRGVTVGSSGGSEAVTVAVPGEAREVHEDDRRTVRIAAIGDLHCGRESHGRIRGVLAKAAKQADVLLLCGDLTDHGTREEAEILARELDPATHLPILAVLGNHDWQHDKQDEVAAILAGVGVSLLDDEAKVVHGIGFAGVKGFLGGFGAQVLQPWGERGIKDLVHQTVEEAIKLDAALAKLSTTQRVVVLHYSPVVDTVIGEPESIWPFLGSSRLEEPINRHPVAAVFHGHAHRGSLEGRTANGTPVYNVALPLLRRTRPDGPPFHLLELVVDPPRVDRPAESEPIERKQREVPA